MKASLSLSQKQLCLAVFEALCEFLRFTPAIERDGYSTHGRRGNEGNQPLWAISHGDRDGVTFANALVINKPVAGLVNSTKRTRRRSNPHV